MLEENSGFLDEGDMVGEYTSSFRDVEVVGAHDRYFFASATRYGRRWFLKGIREKFVGSTLLRQQMLKEFEILSRLSHPGVVTPIGVEEIPGFGPCIVMEWIEGVTLQDLLVRNDVSRSQRRKLLLEILETMEYIHSKGIVHRDLKPTNIMVRANGGKAVIVDFGLADTDEYTLLKNPAGTPGYMSERQKCAATPFTGDDVYTLGVIMQTLYPEYRRIIRRCTGRPEKRFTDAGELLHAVRNRGKRKRRILTATAMLTTAAALTMTAGLLIDSRRTGTAMTELENRLDSMTLRATREQDLRLRLSDSIEHLGMQLESERELNREVREHDSLMQSAKQRLRNEMDKAYMHFLRTDENPVYGRDGMAVARLLKGMASAKERMFATLPGLTDSDREALELTYSIYQGEISQRWTNETRQNNER